MERTFVVCDLETTGLDPLSDKIIEIGLVRLEEGEITQQFHALVNPEQPLSIRIKRLTGLADADLARALPIHKALPDALNLSATVQWQGIISSMTCAFGRTARGHPLT